MASSSSSCSSSSPTTIHLLKYTVFAIERLLIFLLILPNCISWICFGFIFTNLLSIPTYVYSFASEKPTVYDLLFLVERVAFILLLGYYFEGDCELCLDLSIILFSFSNLVHLIIGQSFNQKDNPIVSEREEKKVLVELGTQTDSSNDQSHENGNDKEEKKINEEKDLDIDHADNEETDKLDQDGVEENGTDSYYEKKLKDLNDEREKKLDAEKHVRDVVINKQINYLDKFIWIMNVLTVQVGDMVITEKDSEMGDFIKETISDMEEEIDEITIKWDTMEKLKEQLKTRLEESLRKCSFLEEENMILDSKLQAVTKMSEFYKSILRNSDI